MLTLRRGQQKAFEPLVEDALVEGIFVFLRQCPDPEVHRLDDAHLRAAIRAGVAQGRAFGLTWQSSLGAFVGLSLVVGPRFHEHPAVRAVLSDESIPQDERIRLLGERLSDEEWEAAAECASERGHAP
ncbi:hypothetical protein [Polyangium mundeleinium]|uniref:Uncharacterized protein n=1 Tax=Polyangium mundeleinium TaxID=2995306 RepID=A0ABT5F4Y5_9BACT|nr:hypothetical protein [Polyangium mundeleinium]MDC0749145.1 hypothetical protein [Polyangium mundeleinium]